MQPKESIEEITAALKVVPKGISAENHYRKYAEAALEALIGAEAAMGQWQDLLTRTREDLEAAEQKLINAIAVQAITAHQLKETSSEKVDVQTWVHPTNLWDLKIKQLVEVVPQMETPLFRNAVRNLLLRLHKILAIRKMEGEGLTPDQELVLAHTRDSLDEIYTTNGGKWVSQVPYAVGPMKPEKQIRKTKAKEDSSESVSAGLLKWLHSQVRLDPGSSMMAKHAYEHYVKFVGTAYKVASKKVFYAFLDDSHFSKSKKRTAEGNLYRGVALN